MRLRQACKIWNHFDPRRYRHDQVARALHRLHVHGKRFIDSRVRRD